jgi:hypothetical protein
MRTLAPHRVPVALISKFAASVLPLSPERLRPARRLGAGAIVR